MKEDDQWDKNARARFSQMLSGVDVTYQYVFLPLWKRFLIGIPQSNTDNLLEIGCGPGVFTKEIAAFFKDVVCLEPSSEMANLARNYNKLNPNLTVYEIPIESYHTKKGFTTCIAHMVLHSISDIKVVFESVYRSLENEGIFAFTIPHPCFYHLYRNDEFVNFDYNVIQKYELEFKISLDSDPLPEKITYFHRPVSDYLNLLIDNNFKITKFEEILPSNDVMLKYPKNWDFPRYVLIVVKK